MSTLSRRAHGASRRASTDGPRAEYLAFKLAGDTYAVRIGSVAEILKPPPITDVPRAGRSIVGVVSVRGRLVTVVDLRRRFGLPESAGDARTRILLVAAGAEELVGLLVDEVLQVYRLAESEIEPATVLGGEQPAHIIGIGRPASVAAAPGGRRGPETVLVLLDLRPVIEL
ncbi:MAG TPA: chemotaxis protein CheW [Polyangiaceae bacterium]